MRTPMMTSLPALTAFAVSGLAIAAGTETTGAIPLKDGSTLHIYQDGKMTMEDKVGRPQTMPQGTPMETKSGKVITQDMLNTRVRVGNPVSVHYVTDGNNRVISRVVVDD